MEIPWYSVFVYGRVRFFVDSLDYLQEKLIHLQEKYSHRPRYCAWRMAFISLRALTKRFDGKVDSLSRCWGKQRDYPAIVFSVKGGMGDLLLANNYIYCVRKYLNDANFNFKICYHALPLLQAFCFPDVETGTKLDKMSGVLKVELNRFPRVLAGDRKKLSQYSPRLGHLLVTWDNFFKHNRKFFDFMPQTDGLGNHYTQLLGAKRISQADIGGVLNMDEEYKAPIPMPSSGKERDILTKFGLNGDPFVTVQRGQGLVTNTSTNNKLWPVEYYNTLVGLIKHQGPRYKIVQLGTSREGFNEDFEGADTNLRGKTNLEEIKVILKHSKLHIDCEGGLVHLRHALHAGPSVVLFGPTSPEVYGYKENLNLHSSACKYPCEWVTNDWLSRCARRKDKNCCMKKLEPQFVFEQINKRFALKK